jgi:hypothetical protein
MEGSLIMFGFGKALDVLRDGDSVRREEWAPDRSLRLAGGPSIEEMDPDSPLVGSHFDLHEGGAAGCWAPKHSDLLAEDWDYVR